MVLAVHAASLAVPRCGKSNGLALLRTVPWSLPVPVCSLLLPVPARRAGPCRQPGSECSVGELAWDKITLVLFSDLQECKLADLRYLLTLADALAHTTFNSALCLFLTLLRAVHELTTSAPVRCHHSMKHKSKLLSRLTEGRGGPRRPRVPHSLGRPMRRALATALVCADNECPRGYGEMGNESLSHHPSPRELWGNPLGH